MENSQRVGFTLVSDPNLVKEENPDFHADFQENQQMKNQTITKEHCKIVSTQSSLEETQLHMEEKQIRVQAGLCDNVVTQENISWIDNREQGGEAYWDAMVTNNVESKSDLLDRSRTKINQDECNKIEREIVTKTTLKQNLKKTQYRCKQCRLFFSGKCEYNRHCRQVHKVQSCMQRNKVVKGSTKMKRHLEHSKNECKGEATVKDIKQKLQQKLICNLCGKHYLGQEKLNLHMYKKHDYLEKGLEACKICKMIFKYKENFLKHMKQHETGLKCKRCPETFQDKKSGYSHSQKHYKRVCPECPLKFNNDLAVKVRLTMPK